MRAKTKSMASTQLLIELLLLNETLIKSEMVASLAPRRITIMQPQVCTHSQLLIEWLRWTPRLNMFANK